MNGRHLSLSTEVQAALIRGEREAARRLIEAAVATGTRERFDLWDIRVAKALLKSEENHGGLYEDGQN
jgi:hypothetical protein